MHLCRGNLNGNGNGNLNAGTYNGNHNGGGNLVRLVPPHTAIQCELRLRCSVHLPCHGTPALRMPCSACKFRACPACSNTSA